MERPSLKTLTQLRILIFLTFLSLVVVLSLKCSLDSHLKMTLVNFKNPNEFPHNFQSQDKKKQVIKRILIWGEFYRSNNLDEYCLAQGNVSKMDFCKFKCEYTLDRNYLNSSDAVVIHGSSPDYKLPPYRISPKQRWVFWLFESPQNCKEERRGSSESHVFNWTFTYRHDSDIAVQYGRIIPEVRSLNRVKFDVNFHKNKKLAAWAVSNCRSFWTPSKRQMLVDELSKYIKIDIYGDCGTLKCPENLITDVCESAASCHKYLGSRYKLYLAFENSMSPEYITEKFFNSLKFGIVPVVLGSPKEDYLRVAPKGSFIHVEDFKTVKELAQYLQHLDSNTEEYIKYFEWTKYFKRDEQNAGQYGFCKLCTKLHLSNDNDFKSYKISGHDWWLYMDSNRETPFRTLNITNDGRILFLEDISLGRKRRNRFVTWILNFLS